MNCKVNDCQKCLLEFEIERLRNALCDARDALRNDFEPDNQSKAWHRANNALTEG